MPIGGSCQFQGARFPLNVGDGARMIAELADEFPGRIPEADLLAGSGSEQRSVWAPRHPLNPGRAAVQGRVQLARGHVPQLDLPILSRTGEIPSPRVPGQSRRAKAVARQSVPNVSGRSVKQRNRPTDGSDGQARAVRRPCQGDDMLANLRLPAQRQATLALELLLTPGMP